MKKLLRNFTLLALLGATCVPMAWAEGPCPPGQRMVGQQSVPGAVFPICQAIPGYGDSQPQPRVAWASRYGAIATDAVTRSGAASVDEESESKAEQMALMECARDGSQDCKIVMSYRDQCVAAATSTERAGYARAPALQTAEANAIAKCGEASCKVLYSACSLAVRLQ